MFETKTYKTILILADNTIYYGWSFKPQTHSIGEVVFNTGMTGYQEIITDPSYARQIINFTYPEIGNTGINIEDYEARKPFIKGIILKNLCLHSSNWRSTQSLGTYLKTHDIAHIYGIDTRALTKHLRNTGTMNGCISTEIHNTGKILDQLQQHKNIEGMDIVKDVASPIKIQDLRIDAYRPNYKQRSSDITYNKIKIVIIDFGVKYNIIRSLQSISPNIDIDVVTANSTIESILSIKPDGILLSNGPGDPSAVSYAIETVKNLIKTTIPIFGICMGHQILSIALGLDTFKLKFGHRGLNHPVGSNQSVNMSSQNHGFAVNNEQENNQNIIMHETNYNDKTLASVIHRYNPYFAVQYHPEASPGPHDSIKLFEHFINIVMLNQKYPQLKNI